PRTGARLASLVTGGDEGRPRVAIEIYCVPGPVLWITDSGGGGGRAAAPRPWRAPPRPSTRPGPRPAAQPGASRAGHPRPARARAHHRAFPTPHGSLWPYSTPVSGHKDPCG